MNCLHPVVISGILACGRMDQLGILGGDSLQELAREEYMSVNALTVRLSRLRTQLREYLQKEGLL